jgi:3-oxoacyl-(acyl-carrier-protein) synthase/thioesterase domain-containing protein/acyl carrier protein
VAESTVLKQVKNIVSKTLKIPLDQLDAEDDFDSFGIDSIIAMELMSNLSKEMKISITPAQFTEVNTIKELAISIEELTESDSEKEVEVPLQKPVEVKEIVSEPLHKEPAQISEQRNTGYQRPNLKRTNGAMYQNVIENIRREFSIDLSYRKFKSLEEIADTLVNGHLDELLSHYNIVQEKIDTSVQPKPDDRALKIGSEAPPKKIASGDIAIVGVSCNFPDAPDASAYWENLVEKKNSIKEIPITRWDWKAFYSETKTPGKTNSKWAALIEDHDCFDNQFFDVSDDEALLIDPQERLLLQEVYKSFQDAAINPEELKGSNTGVYVSYEYSEFEHFLRNNIENLEIGSNKPFFSSSSPTYFLANRLSFLYDFNGPSESFNVNCAGSAVAVNRAYQSLLTGETDLAVVGGVSLNLFADDYIALSNYGMLSPDGTCAVFDNDANGFTRGEGVASVVLKRLSDAEKDNDKIYAVIKSSSQNNRGKARFIQEIDTESISNVLESCYEKAAIEPQTVNYIEVDGYATKWGDSFEYEGIKKVFKKVNPDKSKCALGSLKGNIGNLESVNGLASLIKLALSMHHKKFPATISMKNTNAFLDVNNPKSPLYIADSEIEFDSIRKSDNELIRAGINAFADTGVNVHILLEEYPEKAVKESKQKSEEPQLFVLSAKDKNRLEESIRNHVEYLSKLDESLFRNTVYTSQLGREAMDERIAIIASSFKELIKKLNLLENSSDTKKQALEKQGIYLGAANQLESNPLNDIFTDEMARMLIYDNQQEGRWKKLAKLWISGFDIPWKLIWENEKLKPVSLPLYPFYKEKFWPKLKGNATPASIVNNKESHTHDSSPAAVSEKTTDPKWFFYISVGQPDEENHLTAPEKVELYLQQQIAVLLNTSLDEVAIQSDFLDLGLNSIDIGTFVSNTMNLLDITMSPAVIFNNPDVKSLANYLCETFPEKVATLSMTSDKEKAKTKNSSSKTNSGNTLKQQMADVLVTLQDKGKKRPFFAVSPGGNGTSLAFQHLVKALGQDQPFYGLEFVYNSQKYDGEITIEKLAEDNVTAITKVQPKGPYRLLGLSNGGMIAFKMAKLLLEKGENIELLAFLDSFSPEQEVIDIVDEILGVFKGKFETSANNQLDLDAEKLKRLPEEERFDYLYDAIVKNGFTIPKEQFAKTYEIARTMDLSCRIFNPSKLTNKINTVLFRATQGYMEGYKNLPQDYGWNKLLNGTIEIYPIEADHFSITDKQQSKEIADKINTLLARSEKGKKVLKKLK